MLRISYKQHVTNKKVKDIVNVQQDWADDLAKQKLRGRPKRTWSDDIKEWSHSMTFEKVKRLAEDREQWRGLVANLRIGDGT